MSIMVPALSRAREAATSMVCKSQLKDIGVATNMYISDQDGYMPSLAIQMQRWNTRLADYMYDRKATGGSQQLSAGGSYDFELFRCPYEARKAKKRGFDQNSYYISGSYGLYGMNQFFTGESMQPSSSALPGSTKLDNCWRRFDSIITPSTLPLFADTNSDGDSMLNYPDGLAGCWWLSAKGPHPLAYTKFNFNGGITGLARNSDKWAFYGPAANHSGKINYLMADGHTETMGIWPWSDHIGTDFHPKRNVKVKPPAPPKEFYAPGQYPAQ